jgi:hypothetical protein
MHRTLRFLVMLGLFGTCLFYEIEGRIRKQEYKEFPLGQAGIKMALLMAWFSPEMLALWIPIVKGLALALDAPRSCGSLDGTMTPMMGDGKP